MLILRAGGPLAAQNRHTEVPCTYFVDKSVTGSSTVSGAICSPGMAPITWHLICPSQQCFSLALASREPPWQGQTTCPTLYLTQSPCNHLGLIPRSWTLLKGEWLPFPDVHITPSPSPGLPGTEPQSRTWGSKNSVPPGYRVGGKDAARGWARQLAQGAPLIPHHTGSLNCPSYIPCASGF